VESDGGKDLGLNIEELHGVSIVTNQWLCTLKTATATLTMYNLLPQNSALLRHFRSQPLCMRAFEFVR
jgi:hypothetical protein